MQGNVKKSRNYNLKFPSQASVVLCLTLSSLGCSFSLYIKINQLVFLKILSIFALLSQNQPYHHFSHIYRIISRGRNQQYPLICQKLGEVSQFFNFTLVTKIHFAAASPSSTLHFWHSIIN